MAGTADVDSAEKNGCCGYDEAVRAAIPGLSLNRSLQFIALDAAERKEVLFHEYGSW